MHNHDLPPAQRGAGADQVLAGYLRKQAGDFLRGLRLQGESGADTHGAAEAARTLRRAGHRIRGTLHTFRPLLDPAWADQLRAELAWVSGVLAEEHACTARLARLLDALARLSGTQPVPAARTRSGGAGTAGPTEGSRAAGSPAEDGPTEGSRAAGSRAGRGPAPEEAAAAPAAGRRGGLTVGGARAGALLERQLTLGRTRAHSAALQALGSSRFHAVADAVALLASEVPLAGTAAATAGAPGAALAAHAEIAERRLHDAVTALPLARAARPYNAEALVHSLATASAGEAQDAPWHQVRHLLRLHAYAQEVLHAGCGTGPGRRLTTAGRTLDRHRDAAEAAAAAAAAARTPRIAPATAYALGVLHADQRHEVEAARFAFQRAWQEAPRGPDGPRDEHALAAP
ncbi:CHAD domain-containing protein [Streptomyces spongiicola]|uniref:CHAD domain-containing protein n=1 Tax=Streptomyces spongiicola TaxID=1690221 RepID=A0A388T4G8_9ACTN|nr:CHAD domain-containing protein [Streptomyces spongiicola]GBQ03853.1 CHAD domain-containing protein [Streptomyces spongiicola]